MTHIATLIFNPMAGMHDWRNRVLAIAELWRRHGWQVDLQATQRSGHAVELARNAVRQHHEVVLAAGGDGTINEVANGLAHSETVLAPLPVGTANCLAKELQLPKSTFLRPDRLLDAAVELLDGRIHPVDLGRCHTRGSDPRYWLLWASVGFDSYVVHHTEPRSRYFKRLGKLSYTAKTLQLLPTYAGMQAKITVDGDSIEGEFVIVNISNARWFAGGELLLNPMGVMDDGLFEVWLFHGTSWPEVVRCGIDIARQIHLRQPQVNTLRGRRIEITTRSPKPAHLDGEPANLAPLTCQIVPQSLLLLTPSHSAEGLFLHAGERFDRTEEVGLRSIPAVDDLRQRKSSPLSMRLA